MASTLRSRYPEVIFKGEFSPTTYIENTVIIQPGAMINLSQNVQISGDSIIGRRAIIEGGCIRSSRIYGRVFGGVIEDSEVSISASISNGTTLRHCLVQDFSQVESGNLIHTILRNDAIVRGGNLITGSEISDNSRVTGCRLLKDSFVKGRALITGGTIISSLIAGDSKVTGGKLEESVVEGNVVVNAGEFSNARLGDNIFSIWELSKAQVNSPPDSDQPSNSRPPDVIIDKATGNPFTYAVCTSDGTTHERSTVSRYGEHRLYTNEAIQNIIRAWKDFDAASSLVRMKGFDYNIPFQLPEFTDPITSQPIKIAVLCSCGQTFDRASIRHWFRQYKFCPVNNHTFPDGGFYPN